MRGVQKKDIPEEYIDYLLMDNFHCLPSELDKENNARLMEFLNIKGLVSETLDKIQKQESKKYGRS